MRPTKLSMIFEGPCGLEHIGVLATVDLEANNFQITHVEGSVIYLNALTATDVDKTLGYCAKIAEATKECERLLDLLAHNDPHTALRLFLTKQEPKDNRADEEPITAEPQTPHDEKATEYCRLCGSRNHQCDTSPVEDALRAELRDAKNAAAAWRADYERVNALLIKEGTYTHQAEQERYMAVQEVERVTNQLAGVSELLRYAQANIPYAPQGHAGSSTKEPLNA